MSSLVAAGPSANENEKPLLSIKDDGEVSCLMSMVVTLKKADKGEIGGEDIEGSCHAVLT